ncbi:Nucleotide-binding universal stress protein, UspA family [Polaribacter sp. KT25b]|uniref:universal stress protein n=1 Tax=Polaribacter sp. KT25b TaxID=1855336 RepID=UPI00087D76F7|nr:universal stress protein [Polaribacter sp. KT25b]SDR67145.1 Nucleotide-binding universal stress protein, UspA family [Polaribacter sp. KT25b]
MKKKIILPTDFSKNALNAISYAIELYKEEPCEFYILHTYYLPGFSKNNLLSPEPTDKKLNEVKKRAEKNIQKLKTHALFNNVNSKHTFYFLNEFGSFNNVLKKIIEKENIKLIIMGTRGETDDKNIILGSNAVITMEEVRNCPVFVIPGNVRFKHPNEIVFPTSFKADYKENELTTLIEISKLLKAPIRILHIKKDKEFSKEQFKNKNLLNHILASTSFTHHELYNSNLHEGIRCFSQSRESEMIAFFNKKHHFFGSVFSNPMVKELGNNANIPILALHDLKN